MRNGIVTLFWMMAALLVSEGVMAEGSLTFNFPVSCKLGQTCFVLLDKNTKTTNIVLNTQQQMQQGVNVVAAAAGTVTTVKKEPAPVVIPGQPQDVSPSCGNQIIIQHDTGWLTQYCHLKDDSMTVSVGQQVQQGQVIGQVGQSGGANFPKLGFMILANGAPADPFTAHLWCNTIPYQPYGVITNGFSDHPVTLEELMNGPVTRQAFTLQDKQVIGWVRMYGVSQGDMQRFTFYKPNGQAYGAPQESTISGDYSQWFGSATLQIGGNLTLQDFGTWTLLYEYKLKNSNAWQALNKQTFTLG
jgi:biotin carboxyl carrier protein